METLSQVRYSIQVFYKQLFVRYTIFYANLLTISRSYCILHIAGDLKGTPGEGS